MRRTSMGPRLADLFCGVGGFRLAMEPLGFESAYASDLNKDVCDTYENNFGDRPYGDVFRIVLKDLPKIDIVTAGFPCQPFSKAGLKQGFKDHRAGTFFGLMSFLQHTKARAFVVENVLGLKQHEKGETFRLMLAMLEAAGYRTSWEVLDAQNFGGAQHRRRVFVVGSRVGRSFDFTKLERLPPRKLHEVLQPDAEVPAENWLREDQYTLLDRPRVQRSGMVFAGYLNKKMWVEGGVKSASRNHRQPFRIYSSVGVHRTISAQETSGRYFIEHEGRVRRLTCLECSRLMGFPDDFPWSHRTGPKFYLQCGNSVHIPTVRAVAAEVKRQLFAED